jgi:hypothetical protein
MSSEYDQMLTKLMRGPLSSFVEARSQMVREQRTAGNVELAERLAALRKPSLVVWALNQAGDVVTDDLEALRAAGDRLRQAQEKLLKGDRSAADQMSEATHEQRRAIETLSRRLAMVLSAAGHAASEETLRRLSDDLRSASIADGETWAALSEGRLLSEPEPPSLPTLDIGEMQRVSEARTDQDAEARRKRIVAAEADVRRAEEFERTAREHEESARLRHEQAAEALQEARRVLAALLNEG